MTTEPSLKLPNAAPAVATVVVARTAASTAASLDAVGRQVYGSAQLFVVGGDDEVRRVAEQHDALWRPHLRAVVGSLSPEIVFVWVLRDRALPRPDALRALTFDSQRVEASVAGSKILDAGDPDLLVSVGMATDVFDAPYSGLQAGEVDQEQYDVIRDVAAVSGISVLIRRDLVRGLQGPDRLLPPNSAAIDFCQRVRLQGGRVVVIPSSEVLYESGDRPRIWRERAGEIRAMLKAYSLVTLLWAVPLAFLTGLVESIITPFFGRWRLFGWIGAWLWNIVFFPSTLVARVRARRGRVVGDEELFRYQTGGSARLKALYDETLERLRARFPEGVLTGFSDVFQAGQQRLRRPAFIVGLLVVGFGLIATRSIWMSRLPSSGFSLLPPESATAALGAYAGGWNPAGFGSLEVLRPEIAATAVVQLALFGKGGLAVALLTMGAFVLGAFGMGRLLRLWGIGSTSGYLAGVMLVGGPAVAVLGDGGHWSAIVAIGALPWAVWAALAPWPVSAVARFGRVCGVALAAGMVGIFAPAALGVPLAAVLLWALVGTGRRWPGVALAVSGTALALPLLMPWILYADLVALYRDGPPTFWDPGWLVIGAFGVVVVATLLGGDRATASIAGWGGLLAVGGAALARAGDLGLGRDAGISGLILVALGTAAVIGAALETAGRRRLYGGFRRGVGTVGAVVAVVLLAVTTLATASAGRAGLHDDTQRDQFRFAVAAGDETTRVLLLGVAADLPGDSRDLHGLGYRVVTPPFVRSWDGYLNDPRLGDQALEGFLDDLLAGEVRRAGERLAAFGIGWVAFTEASPLEALFEAQLDLIPLRSLDFPVFRNEVAAARAMGGDGTAWVADGTGFTDPAGAGGPVYVASNADYRWGPGDWEQADWANGVTVVGSSVAFAGHGGRRDLALGAAVWLGLLVLGVSTRLWTRRRS